MENAAKALEIAAGVLLAILIMSLISLFFSNLGIWPEEEDSRETAEQLAKFNLEYEVYDKKGMYGTDVISCLTKAKSNNEKYALGGKYLSGSKYGEQYWINVYVRLKDDLEELVTVYYYDPLTSDISSQQIVFDDRAKEHTMGEAGFIFATSPKGVSYTLFTESTPLDPTDGKLEKKLTSASNSKFINLTHNATTNGGITYNCELYDMDDVTSETPLQVLLETAGTNLKQVVRNHDGETLREWSSAEWLTALYDFKTRRFRCDDMHYSDVTGRVKEIYFSEI